MGSDQSSATAGSGGTISDGLPEQLLSIREAALRYGVPAKEITKLAYHNQLDGARKVRGAHGMEWRVAAAELEARGFQRQVEPSDAVSPEVVELQHAIRVLTDTPTCERERWAEKQRELETAMLEIGRLKRELRRERMGRQQGGSALSELVQTTSAADTTVDLRVQEEQQAR